MTGEDSVSSDRATSMVLDDVSVFLHYIVPLCILALRATIAALLDSLPTLASSVTTLDVHSFDTDPHTTPGCVVTALGRTSVTQIGACLVYSWS